MEYRQDSWLMRESQGVCWRVSPLFEESGLVLQGFCGRRGGVSLPPFASLNISYSTKDAPFLVQENRRRFAASCGFELESWRGVHQVHGVEIVRAEAGAGESPLDPEAVLPQADGQITDVPGLTLVSQHADCIPLYFLDPVHRAVGLAHAGWRGTFADMAGRMVEAMAEAYHSRPEQLFAAIGPGAGVCHYEVDAPVIEAAMVAFGKGTPELARVLRPGKEPGKAWADLPGANALLLERRGVLPQNISLAGICTICENREFFSHRQKDAGRQCAFLQLI